MNALITKYVCLALSAKLQGVTSAPIASSRATNKFGISNARSTEATVFLARASQASEFTVLLHSGADPVDLSIATDCLVEGIDADDLNKEKISLLVFMSNGYAK